MLYKNIWPPVVRGADIEFWRTLSHDDSICGKEEKATFKFSFLILSFLATTSKISSLSRGESPWSTE